MTRTLIVIPMKDPSASKTRLADTLGRDARERLVWLLYEQTLRVLSSIADDLSAEIAVVTACPAVAEFVAARDVRVIPEPNRSGLSNAIDHAAKIANSEGFARLCVIPADLAAPSPKELRTLFESTADVTVCPSNDNGTNALLVSPPDAIQFCYGPQSATRHMHEATRNGLNAVLLPLESLVLDIDTSACLGLATENFPNIADICA